MMLKSSTRKQSALNHDGEKRILVVGGLVRFQKRNVSYCFY